MTKAQRQFERAFDDAFRRLANGVQFNILDLGPMRQYVLASKLANINLSMDDAMQLGIAKYRKN